MQRTTCDARGQVSRELDGPAQRGGLSVAVRPLGRGGDPLVGGGTTAGLLEERTLLEELWRISHFGWMPEAVIGRALTLAGGGSFRPAACIRVCGGSWTAAGSNTTPARTLTANSTGG